MQWYDPHEMRRTLLYPLLIALLGGSFAVAQSLDAGVLQLKSPNGQISLTLSDAPKSQTAEPASNDIHYSVEFRGKRLLDASVLGLKLQGQASAAGVPG